MLKLGNFNTFDSSRFNTWSPAAAYTSVAKTEPILLLTELMLLCDIQIVITFISAQMISLLASTNAFKANKPSLYYDNTCFMKFATNKNYTLIHILQKKTKEMAEQISLAYKLTQT